MFSTSANITLSGLSTPIDGMTPSAGDRVLVRAQSSNVNNGIYVAASGAWSRATDFDGAGEVTGGTIVAVTSGTDRAGSSWKVSGASDISIGSDPIIFEAAYDSESVRFLQTGGTARSTESKLKELLFATDFGVVADGSTDNTTALNAAIAAAIASSGSAPGATLILPPGEIRYGTPLTLPDQACTLKIMGSGRPRSMTGGESGDPNFVCGSQLTYTGSTGDAFGWTLTGSNKRVYLTLENLTIVGNEGGSSGHGIHLQAADATLAFLVCYRDVSVMDCKQNNIFHDGAVFESQLYNVRSNRAGGCAFKAAANSGGLPGETRFFGGTFNTAGTRGIDLSGGGTFSLHGVSCTANTEEGLHVYGVNFFAFDLQLEANSLGDLSGNQATFDSTYCPIIVGCVMTVVATATGKGLAFVSAAKVELRGYRPNSSVAGVGYYDVHLDNGCRACTITGYLADDFVPRVYLGTDGGHELRGAREWNTGQSHAQIAYAVSSSAATSPDAVRADSFLFNSTSATLTIGNPLRSTYYHDGQRITITVYNNSGGALTVSWGTDYLKSAFTAPANTKRKSIMFEWQSAISKWVQIGSASSDL